MKSIMKKSTGILLLLTFLIVVIVVVGLFATMMVFVLQGTTPNLLGSKRIALVRVEGIIYDAEDWIDQVQDYQEDSSVQAIVLRVESPGGAVGPSQDLYEALVKAQEEYGKIVVASFGSVAASGGYYVACNADQIVSAAGSMTGSIGVYAKFPVAKELMEKIGFTYDTVKAGEYKDFGSMERGLSYKEREMMQGVIDDTYEQFVEAVMKGRKEPFSHLMNKWDDATEVKYPLSQDVVNIVEKYQRTLPDDDMTGLVVSDTVLSASSDIDDTTTAVKIDPTPDKETLLAFTRAVSEGKVYTGRQALKVGLVDKLGSLEDAIKLAAEMSGISGEPTVIERKKRESSLLDYLSEGLSNISRNQTHSPLQYRFPY